MTIIAKTIKGKEYMYNAKSARRVADRSAVKVCEIVNKHKYLLGENENEIWHVYYHIDPFDVAYEYASMQSFSLRNGVVSARNR